MYPISLFRCIGRIPVQYIGSGWIIIVPDESSELVMRFMISEWQELSHRPRPPNSHFLPVFKTHFHSLKPDTELVIKVYRFNCCCSACDAVPVNETGVSVRSPEFSPLSILAQQLLLNNWTGVRKTMTWLTGMDWNLDWTFTHIAKINRC